MPSESPVQTPVENPTVTPEREHRADPERLCPAQQDTTTRKIAPFLPD